MCKIHNFSLFLQRVHCVEFKSAVDVEMFTALPDSASSLFTATQTANAVRAMTPVDDAPSTQWQ